MKGADCREPSKESRLIFPSFKIPSQDICLEWQIAQMHFPMLSSGLYPRRQERDKPKKGESHNLTRIKKVVKETRADMFKKVRNRNTET